MTPEQLRDLPKVELHCHLDGSLSREFVEGRLGREVSQEELSVDDDCQSLVEYLDKFTLPISCIQDAEGLAGAGYDVLRTMAAEHVVYAEVRFAPTSSLSQGLTVPQVLEALISGLERGREEFGVEFGVLCCAMRHEDPETSLAMFRAAREFLGAGVVGGDLAGAEAAFPQAQFMDLFAEVKRLGMPFTLHAGECGEVANVVDAVEAGAVRVGHGIAARGHADVERMLADRHIGVEMCPVSNLQTKAVPSAADYPIREFLDAGMLVSVNTDNRTVSGTSLTRELALVQSAWGVTDDEIRLMQRNAAECVFAGDDVKDRLLRALDA